MASDPIVLHPDTGPSGGNDADDESPVLGPVIRSTKYCKIHTVVASSWQSEPAEAHVFESSNKAQARFLNRSVWPKLRKSPGFKQEVKKDDGRTIFIISEKGPNLAKEAETSVSKSDKLGETTTAVEAIPPTDPAAVTPLAPSPFPTGYSSSAVGKSIFLRYHQYCNEGEASPAFQSDGLPISETAEAISQLLMLELMGWFENERPPPVDEIEDSSAKSTVFESWEEHSDEGPKRPIRRQIPEARHLQFILSLADEIAKESLDCGTDGECQFGYRFMIEHLYPWQKHWLASQALSEQTNRQRSWSDHLDRILQYLPGILKTQDSKAEKVWLASLPELHRIFGVRILGAQQSQDQASQNAVVMRWIIERSFSGFGLDAVALLADSFNCDSCDGEPIMRWMLRIRSHVRMRKWAIQELSKAPDALERANPVLMRLIEAHSAHELVLGMKPILERMYLVSQYELGYWEGVTAVLHGNDMKELERISDRWGARRSILKSKGRD